MSRWLRIGLMSAAALLLVAATAWYWLLHTSNGARFVWTSIQKTVPGELRVDSMDGDFSTGLHLSNLQFRNASVQVAVLETRLSVDVDLIPLSAEITVLELRIVDVHLQDGRDNNDTKKMDIAEVLSAMRLPLSVSVTDFRMTDLSLAMPEQEPRLLISSMAMVVSMYDTLSVERLEVATPFVDVSSEFSLELQAPFAVQLQAGATINDIGVEEFAGSKLTAHANGNLDRVSIDLNSIAPDPGQVRRLLSSFDIKAVGSFEKYEITADAEIHLREYGDLAVSVAGAGTPDHLKIDKATARGDAVSASASGQLDWSAGLGLIADVHADKFDPRAWVETWPESHPLEGEFSGSWQGSDVEVSRFELRITDTDIRISGDGHVDLQKDIVEGELDWRGIQWPVDSDMPAFVSDTGDITVKGNPDAWTVDGAILLRAQTIPEGALTVNGNGDRDGIVFTIQDSNILGGHVTGLGSYRWRDNQPFTGSLQFKQIRTAVLLPDWPGIVTGETSIQGTAQPFAIDVDVTQLVGRIREQPVAANGALSYSPESIGFRKFNLTHADSAVALDGQPYEKEGLSYKLSLADLGSYVDGAAGSIEALGNVSLNASAPRLRGELTANQIAFGDVAVASVRVEDNAAGGNEFISQSIVAHDLRLNDKIIDTLSITAAGDAGRHELAIDLKSEDVTASLSAAGAMAEWQDMAALRWQGEIDSFQVTLRDQETLALSSPVSLSASANDIQLDQACLDVENREALCVAALWARETSVDIVAELRSAPLSALLVMVDTDLAFTQEITGQVSWTSTGNTPANGDAKIEISPGRVINTLDPSLDVDTGKGLIGFQVRDGALGSGTINLPFPKYGTVAIDFNVGDLTLGANSPLSGHALIDLNDIRVLTEIFPSVDSAGGHLETDLAIAGTLSRPNLIGTVTLRDASLRYLPLGTALTDLQIDVAILEGKQVELEGRFRAGEGSGTVKTTAAYEMGQIQNLEFDINGSNLLLVDDPQVRLVAEPSIKIGVRDGEMLLNGKIRIPKAKVKPTVIPQTPISESADVTIIAGDYQEAQPVDVDDQRLRINGTLEVEFGEDVRVDLDVAKAKLGGSVLFEWHDEFMPIARGSYTIDGSISAYGQVLDISEGIISFPSVPANNPRLRISATREIYGNTQVKTAGILVSGTAKKPVIEAYTHPLTTAERALALLVTGSDFDYEQGVGALDFGMYIAPRLYLSYGVGLFDRDNVISTRYDLKKGFGIKASSGEQQSGIDLSYRVDK
jgi:translocation and assembly module TamB